MTIFNLADYNSRTRFEGDYVGNLAAEMEAAAKSKIIFGGPAPVQAKMVNHQAVPYSAEVAHAPVQKAANGKSLLLATQARQEGWHGQSPIMIPIYAAPYVHHLQAHQGGGGSQAAFAPAAAPRIREATVAAEETAQPGWRTVGNYKGFLVQEYRSHLQRPLYRGVWGQEATPPRANPTDTHQDIDQSAEKPRISFTRNLPAGAGIPDDVRAAIHTRPDLPAWNRLGQKLARIRAEWGRTGHVETYKGVRIFRGKRNIKTPDGNKITIPFYYTKQRLKGVNNGQAPLEGYLGQNNMNNHLAMVDGKAETETLDDMKAIIDTHPIAETDRPSLDEGPGPAAGAVAVEALPGEAGTSPEITILSDPKNRTTAVAATGAAALLAYFMM